MIRIATPGPCAAAMSLLAAILLLSGGCCINIHFPEPPAMAALAVGGEDVIRPLMHPELEPAAEAVREVVREAGFTRPRVMLGADGLGLVIEDDARLNGPLLVWRDWRAGEPEALEDAAGAQWISSRHFIIARAGEQWVTSVDAPGQSALVDPAFDPLLVRVVSRHGAEDDIWCAAIANRLYIGELQDGIVSATTIRDLPHDVRSIAALEPQTMALVETVDGQIAAWDLSAPRPIGLRIEGTIDWPWATPVAALPPGDALEAALEESLLPRGATVIHDEELWWVAGLRGGIQDQRADVQLGLAEGEAWVSTLEPGQTPGPRAPMLRSAAWRGIVWPPSGPTDAGAPAPAYLAMTPLPRGVDDNDDGAVE